MQNHFYKWIFVMGYLFFHSAAQAKTVVLVHGFQGDKTSWYKHGTVDALLKARWIDLTPLNDEQIRQIPLSKNAFVSVSLPWYAPIEQQSHVLADFLNTLQAIRPDQYILVGHSVGGVVSRFTLVTEKSLNFSGLITIASPHQGTPWAQLASEISQSPLNVMLKLLAGDDWNYLKWLLWDISTDKTSNLLDWLNRQPHPDIHYVSIVHMMDLTTFKMDMVVPEASQDLRQIPVLSARAQASFIESGHQLTPEDGDLIVYWLMKFK